APLPDVGKVGDEADQAAAGEKAEHQAQGNAQEDHVSTVTPRGALRTVRWVLSARERRALADVGASPSLEECARRAHAPSSLRDQRHRPQVQRATRVGDPLDPTSLDEGIDHRRIELDPGEYPKLSERLLR